MQQFFFIISLIALILLEYCTAISFTNQNYDGIQVGVPFNLTWEGAAGAVVLGLLFRINASSPQNTTIIATGITESHFTWIPPDWTKNVFAQKIEAQDASNNLALTGNFTIAKAVGTASSGPQINNVAVNTANTQPPTSIPSQPKNIKFTQDGLSSGARLRIGFAIAIVMALVIILVALVFFEHGKRVAAKALTLQRPHLSFEQAEQGVVGLELAQRKLADQKESEGVVKDDEPATPLLLYKPYRKPKLDMDLDGVLKSNAQKDVKSETEEERSRRILSVRSVYELG